MVVDSTEWLNISVDPTNIKNTSEVENNAENTPMDLEGLETDHFHDFGILQDDALEYIAGYIIRKLNLEEYQSHEYSFSWVDQVSKGYLKKPSPEFLDNIKRLEVVFESINGKEIDHHVHLKQRLFEKSIGIDLPDNIKSFYFKCRIHFRIKHLNRQIKIKKSKQRLMSNSKLLKITL